VPAVPLISKLLSTFVIALFGGSHQAALYEPPPDGGAARRMYEARPTGEWMAVGHVITADQVYDRHVGEVLRRRWRFETRCDDGSCRTYFLRRMARGYQSSPLQFRRLNYLAEFDHIGTDCEVSPGWFATFGVTFSIWWTGHHSRLEAEEMGGWRDRRCGYYGEQIHWTARRIDGGPLEGTQEML
jgi:hypothetical protein